MTSLLPSSSQADNSTQCLTETKQCKCCGEIKPFYRFTKNKNCRNGITNTCRDCSNYKQQKIRNQKPSITNGYALKYRRIKKPDLLVKDYLKKNGLKKCNKCLIIYPFSEFLHNKSKCYKCRTGHERGYKNSISLQEIKKRKKEYNKQWRKLNINKVKGYEKKSRSRPVAKKRNAELKKIRYYNGKDKESRIKYKNSVKGILAIKKSRENWISKNKDKIRAKDRALTYNLSNCYVKTKLKRAGFPKASITKELVDVYRTLILTKRLIKQHEI